MMHRSKLYSPGDLLIDRGWTKELIAEVLGDPDMVLSYPRDKARQPEGFFLRTRVFGMEQKKEVQAVTVPRLIEIGERQRAKKARLMRDAADAAEIVVETMSIHDLKIRALETWYEELAKGRSNAPSSMDERRIAGIAFRFATRRLVDYDRIIAALPAPLDKPEVYDLCRERIDAAVIALYPQIAPPVEEPLAAEEAAQVEPGETEHAPPATEEPAPSHELKPSEPDTTAPPPVEEPA